jgi:signal transduction histidine kinase
LAQLAKKRTALALYSLLLVLPTFVLGGLHWRQLQEQQTLELAEVPVLAEAGRDRLVDSVRTRLEALLESESERPFNEYQDRVYPEDLMGPEVAFVRSSLVQNPAPPGVLAWFAWDFREGPEADKELFAGRWSGWEEWQAHKDDLELAVEELIAHDWADGFPKRITRYTNLRAPYRKSLTHTVINLSKEQDIDCLVREEPALRELDNEFVEIYQYDFHVRFYLEPDGTPRVLATRLILIDGNKRLARMPLCYSNLAQGATLIQGFFIDPTWLFGELPLEIASQVLREPETFHALGSPSLNPTDDLVVEKVYLVDDLEFETYRPQDSSHGELQISISTQKLRLRHRNQTRGFLAVAFMLLLSLGTGMHLLLRSVKRDLDQARRTENFVAAVTHELRTPVSAVRLYGEMLRDGWAANEEKRQEYYGRIVTEALRLETMVERVLEKSQLASVESKPQVGDLNAFLSELATRQWKPATDLRIELAPDFPRVWMNPEAMRSIVTNLIENARKYAPPGQGNARREPILVRTVADPLGARLEVLDRGPGIPNEEKRSVFEAFYRRGDEGTRRSKGTGLGLHLVKIQAQSIGGDVEVFDRPGGGCLFRVRLSVAPEEDEAEPA